MLGDIGGGEILAGIDLDSCLSVRGITPWAQAILDAVVSYAEVSPSGSGIKLFFRVDAEEVDTLRELLALKPAQDGRKWLFGASDTGHPPSAELYLARRYFTVTGQRHGTAPPDVVRIDVPTMRRLAAALGATPAPIEPPPDLMHRLDSACAAQPRLKRRWEGGLEGLKDASRSGFDMSLGGMLKTAGFDRAEVQALLARSPHSAGAERAAQHDDRYFDRIWARAQNEAPTSASPSGIDQRPPLIARPASLRRGSEIPPRAWLYGTRLVRRYVSALVAPGGVGKTAVTIGIAIAVATGKPLLGEKVWVRGSVWILNLEDPLDEVDRRIAAAMDRHGIEDGEHRGRLFTNSGRDREVVVVGRTDDGFAIVQPDKEAVIAEARAREIALLIVDPFIRSHRLDENKNVEMDQVIAAWGQVAEEANCAVLLVHHARKGASQGDIEASRGAKALTDGARVGMLLSPMTADEAAEAGISGDDRLAFVRLENAKANLTARSQDHGWLKLESASLGNPVEPYTAGDSVQVVVPWLPADVFEEFELPEIDAVLDRIKAGHEPGILNSKSRQGGSKRWVGEVLIEVGGRSDAQAKEIVRRWLASGLLVEESFPHPRERRQVGGVRVDDAKRPGSRP